MAESKIKSTGVLDKMEVPCETIISEKENVKKGNDRPAFQKLITNMLSIVFMAIRDAECIESITGKVHGACMAMVDGCVWRRVDVSLNKKHKIILKKIEDEKEKEEKTLEFLNERKECWVKQGWIQTGKYNGRNMIGYCPLKKDEMPNGKVMDGEKVHALICEDGVYKQKWVQGKTLENGTYEICGGNILNKNGKRIGINGNVHKFDGVVLVKHGEHDLSKYSVFDGFYKGNKIDLEGIKNFFDSHPVGKLFEGFVIKTKNHYFKVHRGHLDLEDFNTGTHELDGDMQEMKLVDFNRYAELQEE